MIPRTSKTTRLPNNPVTMMTGSSQNFFRVRMYSQTQIRIPFLPSLRSLVRAKPTDCAGFNTRTTSGLRNHSVVSGRFRWRFSETKNDVYSRVKRSLCAADAAALEWSRRRRDRPSTPGTVPWGTGCRDRSDANGKCTRMCQIYCVKSVRAC